MIAAALLACSSAWPHGEAKHGAGAPTSKAQKPWGIAGDARTAQRKVEVRMLDSMRFEPDAIEVREGDTLRIVVHNAGAMRHEFVLGTRAELDAHAALMLKFPDMAHDEPYMAHVAPGRSAEIVWRFNRAGEFMFACLMAGHYQAGMVGRVRVLAAGLGTPASAMAAELTEGEIRKVDVAGRKLTIAHGEISNLQMPPMTMVFQVKDAAWLAKLKAGDKVRFAAEKAPSGYWVTQIQKAK